MDKLVDIDNLRNIDDAAKLLKKGRATIYRWLEDGKLKSITIGGKQFIPLEEITRILKGDTDITKAMLSE